MTDSSAPQTDAAAPSSPLIVVGIRPDTTRPDTARPDPAEPRPALAWAVERARATGAALKLVAVVDPKAHAPEDPDAHAIAPLEALAAPLRTTGLAVTVEVIDDRHVDRALPDAATDAALLVIGTDHVPGSRRERGHLSRHLVSHAHCSVAVVPDLDEAQRREGVVVGVDGSDVSHRALAFAADEAARLRETLTIVSTWMPVPVSLDVNMTYDPTPYGLQAPTEAFAQTAVDEARTRHPDLDVRTRVAEGDAAIAITDASTSARLTVVGTHGRGGLARLLLGSTSTAVLENATAVTVAVR
ncbi:universal stress protein [Microbacterium aurantiacum]|uniref:universal stress protein n=1 Tax=Microbacterium aurantiacum TaxID=162393 RepID=UPI0006AD5C9B|nr:universal stress protein [Microbacterium chocolatum]